MKIGQTATQQPLFANLTRSELMSRIRGKGNKTTELRLAALLRVLRITGWRRHTQLKGRPDFTFSKQRVAIFVDGCFWHGCPEHFKKPNSNAEFWEKKIEGNRARDRRADRELKQKGWQVLRVWEHELRASNLPSLSRKLRRLLPARLTKTPENR